MLVGALKRPIRGFLMDVPVALTRSALSASVLTSSSWSRSDSPVTRYLPLAYCTSTPAFQARLSARNVLFCAGSSASAVPAPVIFPAGGTMAAAPGSALKPMPGTLSNGAASDESVRLYGVGFALGSGSDPNSFIFDRTSCASGTSMLVTVTPIESGSVHPAASYG